VRLVIADTDPVHYLILIEHIGLLPRLFERVGLPGVVLSELAHQLAPASVRHWAGAVPAWLEVAESPVATLPAGIHKGEAAAIELASIRWRQRRTVLTHVIHVAPDVLSARLQSRNRDLPKYNFAVPLKALQRFTELYEKPSNDEGAELVYVDGSGSDKDGARVPNRVTDPFPASSPPPQFNRRPPNFT
jgi:hypothetical protein